MSVVHSRELADTLQEVRLRHGRKRCRYCCTETRSSIGVCLAHSDLLRPDPHKNQEPPAARFPESAADGS